MENISFKGENYIKSSKIADELGYTTDYVGQLCRSGQVNATLVGRTWYVSEKSIREHKKNRYRGNLAKSHSAVKKLVQEQNERRALPLVESMKTVALYEEDTQPLLPRIEKNSANIDVIEAVTDLYQNSKEDAEPVAIKINREPPKVHYSSHVSHIGDIHRSRQIITEGSFLDKRPSSVDQKKHHRATSPAITIVSSAVVAAGFLLLLIFIGTEQRFFASRVLPPETYYHFDLVGGVYAALEAGKAI